jgi:hypothetical protein
MAEIVELGNEGMDAGIQEGADTGIQEGAEDAGADVAEEGAADAGADNGVYGAPESYDYKDVKIPDDYEYDKDMLKEFDALNKETNLSQAQANKYMEFGLRLAQKHNADLPKLLQQVQQAKVTQFKQAMNTDAEIGGGDKAKMNAYLDVADKGYVAFANDDVKAALAEAGLNYHPAIIKMFHRIGTLVGDDKIYNTKNPSGTNDVADILYGSN